MSLAVVLADCGVKIVGVRHFGRRQEQVQANGDRPFQVATFVNALGIEFNLLHCPPPQISLSCEPSKYAFRARLQPQFLSYLCGLRP